jgi:ABC-type branched-subunit amino acid transport system substrate-binding protein
VQRFVRSVALVSVCAALVAACTSSSSSKQASTSGTSDTAVPADAIHISLISADLSILTQQHLAPDIGDPGKVARAVVADINAHGGVAGKKLAVTVRPIANTATATDAAMQQVCVQATEEDKPFAVVITAAVPVSVVQCSAVGHQELTITMDAWQQAVYNDAKGRLFAVGTSGSADIERQYGYAPALLQTQHILDGKTVGILNQDQPADRAAAATALKVALAKAGIPLAAEATAPLQTLSSCGQTDAAIQRMQQAKVDFVFLLGQNLCGSSLVAAAKRVGYKPEWATLGNNVSNTVAQFYSPSKDIYDGAWGLGGAGGDATPEAKACNDIAAKVGVKFALGTDGYGFTSLTCMQIQTLANAMNAAAQPLTQDSVMKALEAMASVPMNAGPPGSLSAAKHDAGDYLTIEKYSAAKGTFEPVGAPQRIP